jgi:hypothetical protein
LVAVSPVEDAVVRVVCPVTLSVPPTTALPDAVMLVADALVSVVCPLAVSAETLVVARYELPETVRAVADAFPSVEVPEVSVEKIPVVNVGLGVTPIVEVEEKTMLEPAMK